MRTTRHKIVASMAALLIMGGGAYLAVPKLQSYIVRQEGTKTNAARLEAAGQKLAIEHRFILQDPAHIKLPRLAVDLDVVPGEYIAKSKTWTLDRTHAFIMQPITTEQGNVLPATPVIYGHNIPAVFTKLDGVTADELLEITQADGKTYTFKYVDDIRVAPDDNSVLQRAMPNTILLMTCTGPRFEERRVLRFELVGADKAAAIKDSSHVLA